MPFSSARHDLQHAARLAVFDRITIHGRREGLLDFRARFHEPLALGEHDPRLVHVARQAQNLGTRLVVEEQQHQRHAGSKGTLAVLPSDFHEAGAVLSPAIRTQPAEQRLDDVAPLPAGQRERVPGLPALAVIQRVLEESNDFSCSLLSVR